MNGDRDLRGDRGRRVMYRIRVEGHLNDHWSDWFGGLTVTPEVTGITTLSGTVRDQAALFGLLAKVRDMGLTLLSVVCADDDREG